jgi:cell division protein FtsZ
VIAQVAKEMGILTVAIVTKPFGMEGKKRTNIADSGIVELSKYVDSLITIPNDKLLAVLGSDTSLLAAFGAANEVLQGAVQGIAELITRPGLINVDFADVRTVMSEMGMAMMGSGVASGDDRAREAAEAAVSSPLLEDIDLAGANGILVNVTASEDLGLGEFTAIGNIVKEFASDDATVVIGTVIDPEMGNSIRVTVVATGLGQPARISKEIKQPMKVVQPAELVALRTGTTNEAYEPDYSDYELPPGRRNLRSAAPGPDAADDLEMLDIPAFLRRQVD